MIEMLIGLTAGIVSGMGIGGGAVLIPAVILFLGASQGQAQSVNLLFFFPTAIIALWTHIKNKSIEKKYILKLISYGVFGAVVGSIIAINLESGVLRKLFAGFLLLMGIREVLQSNKQKSSNRK